MRPEQRRQYNALRDDTLPHVMSHIGLSSASKQVGYAAGLGDAILHRREMDVQRRAKRSAARAARRRNR